MTKANVRRVSPPLDTHDVGDGLKALDRPLGYQIGFNQYWVDTGYRTDFASIPWFARFIVRWNKVDDAAVLHDMAHTHGFLYADRGMVGRRSVSWWEANRIFRQVARSGRTRKDRANVFQAWLTWGGLTLGSYPVWHRNKKKWPENNQRIAST